MNIIQRMVKNIGIIILGTIISRTIELVAIICLARYLGANGFGIYSFVIAYLMFFEVLSDLGMRQILVREVSRSKEIAGRLLGNAIIIKIGLSLISILLASLVISLLNYPFDTKLLAYVASLALLFSFINIYRVIFEVDLKMEYWMLGDIVTVVIKLGLFLLLIFLKATLLQFIISGIIASLPGLVVIIWLSNRLIKPTLKIELRLWRYLLKESWPLSLNSIFIIIYTRIDQIMLFHMKGTEAAGYYSAPVRLVEALGIIPLAFMASVFPIMSKYFKTSKDLHTAIYRLSFKYMVIIITPIVVGTTLLARSLICSFYGDRFLPAILPLQVLIWSEVFVFMGVVNNQVLISADKQKIDFLFTSSMAVVNILLNLLLIPKYSIVGAAVATTISYGVGLVMGLFIPATRDYSVTAFKSIIKPIIASLVMGGYIYYILSLNLTLSILTAPIIYFGVLLLIKEFSREEISLLIPILKTDLTG